MTLSIDTQAQKERFENFLKTQDLVELGRRYFKMVGKNAEDGRYTPYVWLLRVLKSMAKVSGTMTHPDHLNDTWGSYKDIFEKKITKAILDHIAQEVGTFA